jgi:hypothetical protein
LRARPTVCSICGLAGAAPKQDADGSSAASEVARLLNIKSRDILDDR